MRNHFSRKAGAAAAAGLLAVSLVACGGDSEDTGSVGDGAADSASEGAEASEADGAQGSTDGADSGASGTHKKDADKDKGGQGDKGPKPTRAADAQTGGSGSGERGGSGGSGGSGNSGASGGSGGTAGNLPQVNYASADAMDTLCGTVDRVKVTAHGPTSCGFAMAVAQQALVPGTWGPGVAPDPTVTAPWGATTVSASDPATGETYTLDCTSGTAHNSALCRGGNGAHVSFEKSPEGLMYLLR